MKEVLKTLRDELKRMAYEGEDFVFIDDESEALLRAYSLASAAGSPRARTHSPTKGGAENFVDDVEPIEFASKIEMATPEHSEKKEKKLKIKTASADFEIADIPAPKPFKLPDGGKLERWSALRDIVLSDSVCNEHLKPGKKVVFGVGNLDAKIFFCGEAPGADEEIQGEPFVGKAGQLLTKIIAAMGLERNDVYIGNIMNWRPELPTSRGNRPPTAEEMNYCLPYLKAQIAIVQPQVIVALGMTAVNGLLGFDPARRMGKVRGTWGKFEGADLMITYHPSFLLQYASNAMKRLVWEDMMSVMERVGMEVSAKQRGYFNAK